MVLIIGFVGMIPANFLLVNLKDAQHEEEGSEARGKHVMIGAASKTYQGIQWPVTASILWLCGCLTFLHKTSANLPSLAFPDASQGLGCILQYAVCSGGSLADLHLGCGYSNWSRDDREVLPLVLQGGLWSESWILGFM